MWPFRKKETPVGAGASPAKQDSPAPEDSVASLAQQLLPLANYFSKRYFRVILDREAEPGDEEKQFLLAMETLYFSTYLAGKVIEATKGADESRKYLTALRKAMYRLLFSIQPGAEKVTFADYSGALETGWTRAVGEYEKFPQPLPKSESDLMEGTLFWEFCKRLMADARAANAEAITAAMQVTLELGQTLPKLLEGVGLSASTTVN
jgi:hypothetical protein